MHTCIQFLFYTVLEPTQILKIHGLLGHVGLCRSIAILDSNTPKTSPECTYCIFSISQIFILKKHLSILRNLFQSKEYYLIGLTSCLVLPSISGIFNIKVTMNIGWMFKTHIHRPNIAT